MQVTKNVITNEINKLNTNPEYWGSEDNVTNENNIFDYFLNNNIVDQDWFDDKLNYTNTERLTELLKQI
jgi:hypothetical protein